MKSVKAELTGNTAKNWDLVRIQVEGDARQQVWDNLARIWDQVSDELYPHIKYRTREYLHK